MLVLDGHVLVEQRGIVGEKVLHELVVDAGDGSLALRVGIGVDEVADVVAETVASDTSTYGSCNESKRYPGVVDEDRGC